MAVQNSSEVSDERPVYWVARGVPLEVDGMRVINHPVQPATFHDLEAAEASCYAWRQIYPDAKLIVERPV